MLFAWRADADELERCILDAFPHDLRSLGAHVEAVGAAHGNAADFEAADVTGGGEGDGAAGIRGGFGLEGADAGEAALQAFALDVDGQQDEGALGAALADAFEELAGALGVELVPALVVPGDEGVARVLAFVWAEPEGLGVVHADVHEHCRGAFADRQGL